MENPFKKLFSKKEEVGELGKESKKLRREDITDEMIIQVARRQADYELSGDPKDSYHKGDILNEVNKEPYAEQVEKKAQEIFNNSERRASIIHDLVNEAAPRSGRLNLEHTDPEAYKKQKEETLKEEEEMEIKDLKGDIEKSLEK